MTKVRQAQLPSVRQFFWLRFCALKQSLIKDSKTRGKTLSRCAFLCRWCAAKENQKRLNYKNDQQSQTGWEIVRSDGSSSLQNNSTAWHVGKDEATSNGWQRLFEVCWDRVIHAIMFETFRGGDDHLSFLQRSLNLQGNPCCSLSWANGRAAVLASLLPDSLWDASRSGSSLMLSVLQTEALLLLYEWSLLVKIDLGPCCDACWSHKYVGMVSEILQSQ